MQNRRLKFHCSIKVHETSFNDVFENIDLQRIMKVRIKKKRRISIDFSRKEYKFELNDCELKDDKIF